MAWVREKNPKRKVSAPTRDPKAELEGLLSFFACKPSPNDKLQRYLREESPEHRKKPKIVEREPTVYDEVDEHEHELEEEYEPEPLKIQPRRSHKHQHVREDQVPRRTPAPRHVSNVERGPYRPRTTVQTRRVVSSWSNATTALAI